MKSTRLWWMVPLTAAALFVVGCTQIQPTTHLYTFDPSPDAAELRLGSNIAALVIDGDLLKPHRDGRLPDPLLAAGDHHLQIRAQDGSFQADSAVTFATEPGHTYRLLARLNGLKFDIELADVTNSRQAPVVIATTTVATAPSHGLLPDVVNGNMASTAARFLSTGSSKSGP